MDIDNLYDDNDDQNVKLSLDHSDDDNDDDNFNIVIR